MPEPLSYCGGLAATNAYVVDLNGHRLAIDAPEGFLDFLKRKKSSQTPFSLPTTLVPIILLSLICKGLCGTSPHRRSAAPFKVFTTSRSFFHVSCVRFHSLLS